MCRNSITETVIFDLARKQNRNVLLWSGFIDLTVSRFKFALCFERSVSFRVCLIDTVLFFLDFKEEEVERVKTLVLHGKIPLDQAPPEMANHPIMVIERYCQKLIAERRAKVKIHNLYTFDCVQRNRTMKTKRLLSSSSILGFPSEDYLSLPNTNLQTFTLNHPFGWYLKFQIN